MINNDAGFDFGLPMDATAFTTPEGLQTAHARCGCKVSSGDDTPERQQTQAQATKLLMEVIAARL